MRSIGSPAPSDVDCWDQEDIPFIYPEGLSEEGEAVLAELNEKTLIKNDETPMDIDEQPLSPTPILPSQEHSNPLVNNPCHEKNNHSIRNPFAMWPASNNTNFVRRSQTQSTPLQQPAGQTIRQVLSSFDNALAQRSAGHHPQWSFLDPAQACQLVTPSDGHCPPLMMLLPNILQAIINQPCRPPSTMVLPAQDSQRVRPLDGCCLPSMMKIDHPLCPTTPVLCKLTFVYIVPPSPIQSDPFRFSDDDQLTCTSTTFESASMSSLSLEPSMCEGCKLLEARVAVLEQALSGK